MIDEEEHCDVDGCVGQIFFELQDDKINQRSFLDTSLKLYLTTFINMTYSCLKSKKDFE